MNETFFAEDEYLNWRNYILFICYSLKKAIDGRSILRQKEYVSQDSCQRALIFAGF